MTKKSNPQPVEICKQLAENFLPEVKETLAIGFINANRKTFTSADLWNIQRRKRSIHKQFN